MNIQRRSGTLCGMAMSLAMCGLVSVAAQAQQATLDGLIIGRDGPVMAVKTADSPRVTVVLSDSTKATETGGFLGMGRKDLGIAALVPGLSVKVQGDYNPDHQLLAKKVVFSRGAMKTAKQIDAGVTPLNEQMASAQDQLRTDRKNIEQSQQDISQAKQDIDTAKQGIEANTAANSENKTAIGATNGRIGELDQYETKNTLTVNFKNGSSVVTKKYKDQLADFLKQAADTPGAMVQVQGYASKVGSASVNQRLSNERASNVLTLIQQSGSVPLTRILAPAAMGTTEQVGNNHTRSGQAENRRVVVTILVNKGITGSTTTSGE